jgi:hypothetical protein
MVKQRAPDAEEPEQAEESNDNEGLEACARELLHAIEARDHKAMARALVDLFQIADSQPHEEGEHVEPHSYEAQNIKAGEEK